jgi:hypothetical protein
MKKALITLGATAAVLLATAGCGRQIDVVATGAQPVPGARNLYYMCHQSTLIYFSSWTGEDDYESFWPGLCTQEPGGKWVYDGRAVMPTSGAAGQAGNLPQQDDGDQ